MRPLEVLAGPPEVVLPLLAASADGRPLYERLGWTGDAAAFVRTAAFRPAAFTLNPIIV